VFPKSWYPDNATPDLWKWSIPACHPCNSEYGALESDLLVRFGLSSDPRILESSGLLEKARRAINPATATNDNEARAREELRRKLSAELLPGKAIPPESIYPGFGERWGREEVEQFGILIPKGSLEKLATKIVKGIFYIEDRRFIEPPYFITFYALREIPIELSELLANHGEVFAHEPGIRVTRAVASQDRTTSFFEIEIWATFKLHASVFRGDLLVPGISP
jgi:hypothetical protein